METELPGDTLETVRAKRGYLLAYHHLLAAHDPGLLRRYDDWYDALTLAPRALCATDREIVWIALVAATRQTVGALHLRRGREAGLSDEAIQAAITLAAVTDGFGVLVHAGRGWPDFAPQAALDARYMTLAETAGAGLPTKALHLAAATCHASAGAWHGFDLHLPQAFAAGASLTEAAEALSFLIHHCGAPSLVAASEAWVRLAATGAVPAPFAMETAS
jgi:alkylhydroperoxidase/carboxymuconolactone decarboxylase family protein YurZ